MTTAIAYNGGAYGTYLEWCLTTLSSTEDIVAPFTNIGNSHNFVGTRLKDIKDISKSTAPFARLHPKITKGESLSSNMDYLCNSADSVVYIYPDQDSILLSLNNFVYKIWKNWWSHGIGTDINTIYNNWPVSRDVDIADIPVWIKQEFLSLYLVPAWFDQVEWCHIDTWQNPKCCVVTVSQLLYDFEPTIQRIKSHCNLEFKRPITELLPFHQENLRLQKYIGQDQICKQIINSIVSNRNLEWDELTLISESWLQWELRNLGYELRCHGLDKFPTNSIQLRELLYTQ